MGTTRTELLIWNKAGNAVTSFSKINILQVEDRRQDEGYLEKFVVRAYLTNGEIAFMGDWKTKQEAKEYIENIHKEVKQVATVGITEEKLRDILADVLTGFIEHQEIS